MFSVMDFARLAATTREDNIVMTQDALGSHSGSHYGCPETVYVGLGGAAG